MIVQCAWCKEVYGEKAPFDDKRITHGMCLGCHAKVMAEFNNQSQPGRENTVVFSEKV